MNNMQVAGPAASLGPAMKASVTYCCGTNGLWETEFLTINQGPKPFIS